MNLIIVIKTTRKEIIGCFVSQLDDPEEPDGYPPLKKRIKDPKILLFQVHSNKKQQKKDNDNDDDDKQDKEEKEDKFEPQCYWANTADQFYHQSNFQLKNMHTMRDLKMEDIEDDLVNISTEEEKKDDDEIDAYLQHAGSHKEEEQRIPVVFPSKESLIIGDGYDNCIYLDNDLNHGFSAKCKTFKSPSLVMEKDGQFQISQVEVW
eukprot:CAMPEP_0201577884 /NCGR_PEP_ID=MMETSP0190_2-20130828/24445_1 /ASSEMBLY_ACC=CAM_ASM_000263 /TAXON_ID=37353 /ORGANISM="Rosalina sp." /LENGTH=205 /DNA_ID=CAMNT_0048010397 /DNA_START=1305 /DNA_END=1919 /DNA_ORIENTATION=-